MINILSNKWIKAIFSTIVLYFICAVLFGFYYGWLDDVQLLALYSGMFTPKGLAGPDHHILLAHFFIWLYKLFPTFPWYGVIHHLILATGITLVNYQIIQKIGTNSNGLGFKVLFFVCFQIIFLIEMVSFFNFTYISMFIAGIGIVSTLNNSGKAAKVIGIVLLILAILIRMEAAIFIVSFVICKFIIADYKSIISKKIIIPAIVIVLSFLTVVLVKKHPSQESFKFLTSNDAIILSIQEAGNINPKWVSPKDSIKIEAIRTWNHFDKYVFTKDFLYQISENFYSKKIISKYLSFSNIKQELNKMYLSSIRYPSEYDGYNWRNKFIIILGTIIIISLLLRFLSDNKQKKNILSLLVTIIVWLATLFVLSIILKLEDRILFPMLLIFGYFLIEAILLLSFKTKSDKVIQFLIVVLFISCSFFQVHRINRFATQKKVELLKKRKILAEINENFDGKTLLFDFHSIYLIHDTPFRQVRLNPNIKYTVAGHYWLMSYDDLQNYYKSLCGSPRIEDIILYYYGMKEDVVFVEIDHNMNILESYLEIVYDLEFSFKKIEDNTSVEIRNIDYSYLNLQLYFNYYVFD